MENQSFQQLRFANMATCSWIMLLLAIVIARGIHCIIDITNIDEDHISQYPHCGTIVNTPLGRMVNTKEAETHYPWVIRIERLNERRPPHPPQPNQPPEFHTFQCMGAILTQRY